MDVVLFAICPVSCLSLKTLMVQLAEGGVGLIISSHAYVSKKGQARPRQLGIHSDKLVAGFSGMTQALHESSPLSSTRGGVLTEGASKTERGWSWKFTIVSGVKLEIISQ